MKPAKIALFIFLFFLAACEKIDKDAPDCIKDLIRKNDSYLSLCETGASVQEYLFQGDFVYVFDPGRCGADMMAVVYSSNCEHLGGLGGFAGNLLINGVRFDQNSTYIKTIWTN